MDFGALSQIWKNPQGMVQTCRLSGSEKTGDRPTLSRVRKSKMSWQNGLRIGKG